MSHPILRRLEESPIAELSKRELQELLGAAELLQEEETGICGPIRALRLAGAVLLQEQTDHDQILLRRLPSAEAARQLIAERLEIYERMWDGCGCKVHYFE
jgi:hypothetical protein